MVHEIFADNVLYELDCPDDSLKDSVFTGAVSVNGVKAAYIHLDKTKRMGTVGSSEGEKITSAFEYATQNRLPVISVVASGGMRVTEGTLALVQMIKMSAAVKRHSDRGLLYVSIITNPTLGGASASFVSLADVIIAEKKAVYGFSGRRIIEATTHEALPDDFQTAEYAKCHGMVDIIAEKYEIKPIVARLLKIHVAG